MSFLLFMPQILQISHSLDCEKGSRYQKPGAELLCLGKEDICGETWVQGTQNGTSTQSS